MWSLNVKCDINMKIFGHMITKIITAISVILSVHLVCTAQQDILYSQYIFSQLSVNPAYAGNNINPGITLISRKQWIGLEGSPASISLFADAAILGRDIKERRNFREDKRFSLFSGNKQLGLGLVLFNDKIGVNNTFQANMAYSYKISFGTYTRLSFGLQMGVLNFNQSLEKLENINANDEVFSENIHVNKFNVGTGILFETQRYFAGFSIPSIIENDLGSTVRNGEYQLRQYFFTAGYLIYLYPLYKLKPTVMVRNTEELPVQFDLNLYLLYNDRIWAGVSYRYKNSVNVSTEILFSQSFSVGLAYDISISEIRKINHGSAEIFLNYVFHNPKKRIVNPRFF